MYTAQENNVKTGGHPSASGQPKFTTPLGASILAIFCVLTQTIHMEASTITVVKLKALLFHHCDLRSQFLSQRGVGTGQKDLLRDFLAPKICMTQE